MMVRYIELNISMHILSFRTAPVLKQAHYMGILCFVYIFPNKGRPQLSNECIVPGNISVKNILILELQNGTIPDGNRDEKPIDQSPLVDRKWPYLCTKGVFPVKMQPYNVSIYNLQNGTVKKGNGCYSFFKNLALPSPIQPMFNTCKRENMPFNALNT